MSRTARLWRGVGSLTLGGALVSAGIAVPLTYVLWSGGPEAHRGDQNEATSAAVGSSR